MSALKTGYQKFQISSRLIPDQIGIVSLLSHLLLRQFIYQRTGSSLMAEDVI